MHRLSLQHWFLIGIAFLVFTPDSLALTPDEVLVVANTYDLDSVNLARYYMRKRGIPKDNLLKLRTTDEEDCSREEYDRKIAAPLRKRLNEKDPGKKIRCLLIMYGMPLRVAPPELSSQEKKEAETLKNKVEPLNERIKILQKDCEERKLLEKEIKSLKKQIASVRKLDQASSLDSEIALVLNDKYPLAGWLPNPRFVTFKGKQLNDNPRHMLMVSRLDGTSGNIVRRIIDDSLTAEESGFKGKAYFDARWPDPGERQTSGYAFYDQAIHRAATLIRAANIMPVVVNETEELFRPGECPDAAIYCGWYKLARYVDAFSWKPGAIGYHIASSECSTLKQPNSQVWCKMMLEKGVAATVGPVSEPYVQAFPIPEVFFGLLIRGDLTLAECYAFSNPFWSWKMVLIGDPLYRPFKHKSIPVNAPIDNTN